MPLETAFFIGESVQPKKEINHGNCKKGSGQESSCKEGHYGKESSSSGKEGCCEEGSTRKEGCCAQEGRRKEVARCQEAHAQCGLHEGAGPQPRAGCSGRFDA